MATRTRDIPACSIVPQPTVLLRTPLSSTQSPIQMGIRGVKFVQEWWSSISTSPYFFTT
jgi:hypothetical protein